MKAKILAFIFLIQVVVVYSQVNFNVLYSNLK